MTTCNLILAFQMPFDNFHSKHKAVGNISENAMNIGLSCASLLRKDLVHLVEDSVALLKRFECQ